MPSEWEVRRLGSMFRQVIEEGDSELPILSVSIHHGVSDREFDEEELDRKVSRSEDRSKYRSVQTGDLVYNMMRAWQGGFGAVSVDGMVSPAYVVARPIGEFSTPYVESLLRTPQAIEQMRRYSQGVTDFRLRLYWDEFKAIRVPLPPLDEQKAISSFLDVETSKIDALVSEQRRLIELLKEKRLAIISHAVTKGLNSNAPMKPSGIQWLGDVPQHWAIAKFGRIAFMQEGPGLRKWQFTDDGTLVICVTNITENGIDFSSFKKFISTEEYEAKYQHFTVERGDILLSSSGNSWGKVAVYDDDERVLLNTSTIRINALQNGDATRDFLQIALQSIAIREQLGVAMTGSCQPNFGPTHLNTVVIALPPPDEQAEIVKYLEERLEKFSQLQAEAERAIELLQERRTALISAAVTGKIDVRDFVSEEAAA
ncbi:type I restriction-modification system, S subunit [Rhodopirellula baltica SH28]|uniref:Type I restriction-modification system, S subunit n=1 Tax=Rhodopirellula baltica SH28 TaxID=993517 RepID=K5CFZ5_RHOBT|nr:type I restriction-modification system, S subunit [Rhodopirellula baltica SH28]